MTIDWTKFKCGSLLERNQKGDCKHGQQCCKYCQDNWKDCGCVFQKNCEPCCSVIEE